MGEGQCQQPLLNGERRDRGKRRYAHGLSSAEVQTLASIGEAVFPSLKPNSDFEGKQNQPRKAVQSFLEASASESPIPDEVKGHSLCSLALVFNRTHATCTGMYSCTHLDKHVNMHMACSGFCVGSIRHRKL